jgi:hypothetical protein
MFLNIIDFVKRLLKVMYVIQMDTDVKVVY